MSLSAKDSASANLIARDGESQIWYPEATAPAAYVEIWWHYEEIETVKDAKLAGIAVPGGQFSFPHSPTRDRNIRIYSLSFSVDGTPDFSRLEEAPQFTLLYNRISDAPEIGQLGDATADSVSVGVKSSTFVRKRRVRIAESMVDGQLINPSVQIHDGGNMPLGDTVDIARASTLNPAFDWLGGDPTLAGFTKVGSAPTEQAGEGWRVNSNSLDGATYYTKNAFPANAFQDGFTLELYPPSVAASDGAGPAQCVGLRIEDGAKRYELTFDGNEVKLNGGAAHLHDGGKLRLVIAAGGLTADLWLGDALLEDNAAGAATAASGLAFGDLAVADDADAIWHRIAYAFLPIPVKLAQTIYISIADSGGNGYSAESEILSVTFASEGETLGGSTGSFDPRPRFKVTYEEIS